MKTLRESGIRSGIFLSPVLPGITDDAEHMEAVVAAAAEHGADFIFSQALRLGPGISEHYLPWLEREFPELVPRYQQLYRRNSPPGVYADAVGRTVGELKRKYRIDDRTPIIKERVATMAEVPRQLALL